MKGKHTVNIPFVNISRGKSIADAFPEMFRVVQQRSAMAFPMDVEETPECIIVIAAIAGASANDIVVEIDGSRLTIGVPGPVKNPAMSSIAEFELRARTITLPVNIDAERSSATYRDGMLKLKLQKQGVGAASASVSKARSEEPATCTEARPLSHAEQMAVLSKLPAWAQEQRVTDVLTLTVRFPVPGDLDDFAEFVMEQAPAPVPAALTSPALSDIDPDSLMAIALFRSGAIRTVGTVAARAKDSVLLSPFDYWSLIDPDDAALAPGPDGILRLELMMLAVAAEP